MSWEVESITTSPPQQRPPSTMSTRGMFRMTEVTPFDPSVLGMQNIRLDAHGRVRSGGSSTCRSSRVHPVSIGDQWADDEKTGLIGGRPKRETMSNASVVTLCAALCLWFMVVCVIFVMSARWGFEPTVHRTQLTRSKWVIVLWQVLASQLERRGGARHGAALCAFCGKSYHELDHPCR